PLFSSNAPATTELYTLSLHDALPISRQAAAGRTVDGSGQPRRACRAQPPASSSRRRPPGSPGPLRALHRRVTGAGAAAGMRRARSSLDWRGGNARFEPLHEVLTSVPGPAEVVVNGL